MISAGDFRNGVTIEIEGNVCQIVEFQHVKPGKGAAFVRTKYKNIITGAVLEKSFRPTEKFPQARIDRVDMSYLYNDGDLYNFMNTETYDQVALTKEQVGDSLKFVKENEVVKVCSWNGNVYAIEPPLFVELEVIDTEPGFAGNTALAQAAAPRQRGPKRSPPSAAATACRKFQVFWRNWVIIGYSWWRIRIPGHSAACSTACRSPCRG